MRHRVSGRKLNRSSGHRKALFKNLAREFFLRGEITTTEAKAKSVRPIVEKLITKAKKQSLSTRRAVHSYFNDKSVTSHVVDVVAPQLGGRTSGYTRIRKVGARRGDNSMMVKLSLVDRVAAEKNVAEKKEVVEKTKEATK